MIETSNIVSGGIGGMIVAVLNQWLTHRNAKIRHKDSLLREKMEACVIALIDDYHFLNKRAYDFIEKDDYDAILPPCNIYKAETMQTLYFPKLESSFIGVLNTRQKLEAFTNGIDAQKKAGENVGTLNRQHANLAKNYMLDIGTFRDELVKQVEK